MRYSWRHFFSKLYFIYEKRKSLVSVRGSAIYFFHQSRLTTDGIQIRGIALYSAHKKVMSSWSSFSFMGTKNDNGITSNFRVIWEIAAETGRKISPVTNKIVIPYLTLWLYKHFSGNQKLWQQLFYIVVVCCRLFNRDDSV